MRTRRKNVRLVGWSSRGQVHSLSDTPAFGETPWLEYKANRWRPFWLWELVFLGHEALARWRLNRRIVRARAEAEARYFLAGAGLSLDEVKRDRWRARLVPVLVVLVLGALVLALGAALSGGS